ncbi:DNA-binding MarR family transcriptional regulator [Pseudonocardia autotrophica]|uniref:HTH-type transcriptional repressor NicR n=3 Tax=Pseudonocardiaceae TaxID=2070 RepID=A0A1Y2N0Z6_PSEAH|nr:HTH-type transcriptional repressor NicR [Pseudonocardia autotrophica]TDN71906.1 DNA-binding MarR family transcriptional regulator [Pseudonocardia autotrophica]BBG02594.1 MarR family transcriptional regulator [Pseudonocardia autotrophica]GEC24653.1 MarR family transcriptional regulator [Pseudonocardia saturnea]
MTRLRARLRLEQASVTTGQTMSQLSVLGRIGDSGPVTASELAQAEHVRAQSIAETVTTLKKQGLVEARPDPADGRKSLLSVTSAGRQLIDSIVDVRGAWLARAIEQHVTPDEREILAQATEILSRVADSRSEPPTGESWRV